LHDNYGKLAKSVLVPVVGGSLVGIFATRNSTEIYDKLKKPAFAPPSWTFPVAWTSLYTIMGIAKYRIASKEKESKSAELLYDTQLGLNFLWSFLFFKWGLRGTAFIEMAALLTLITLTAFEFYKIDRTSGLAMIPYIAWVTFALGLNFSIFRNN
jgi:tryptophan-rich sensory protein